MGMLLVVFVLLALAGAAALFSHALRSDPSPNAHGWLVVLPLIIIFGWVIEQIITG
jgi:hypothetical protein